MPKGRGSNDRRRNQRQRHPTDRSDIIEAGAAKLQRLFVRAQLVQKRRRRQNR